RHFHTTGSERRIDEQAVGDDRDLAVHERDAHRLADEMPIARIVGVYGDGGIAEHGFRARRGEADELTRSTDWIAKSPEAALHFFGIGLIICHRSLELRVPVHQAFAAIDVAVAEHLEKSVPHGAGANRIERESRSRPIAGATELLQLVEYAGFI